MCEELRDGDWDVLEDVPSEVLAEGEGDLLITVREETEFCLLHPSTF